MRTMLRRAKKSLDYLQYRYELETHLYMVEPFEKRLVNTVLLILLLVTIWVSYLYVPSVLNRLMNALTRLPHLVEISSLKMQPDDL